MTTIVIAPVSNDRLRDWPVASFVRVAQLCVDELDATTIFVGTRAQRLAVNPYLRTLSQDRFVNRCGQLSWQETGALVRKASCVIVNNSGVAHLAASLDTPVVTIFSATHSPYEWMPRGSSVKVITKKTVCAPCGIGTINECRFGRRCFIDIDPLIVFKEVRSQVQNSNDSTR